MANKFKSAVKISRGGAAIKRTRVPSSAKEVIFVRSGQQPSPRSSQQARLRSAAGGAGQSRSSREAAPEEEADDVIDLGAPRRPRRAGATAAPRRALPPNPRLSVLHRDRAPGDVGVGGADPRPSRRRYPGPEPKPRPRRAGAEAARARRGKRPLRRPVPNSRLYRPAPPRPPAPPPPPARPRAAWPPPAPPRALDTASRAALRLGARAPSPSPSPSPSLARRLVVTLPGAAARYRPASEHFRARASAGAGSRGSTPPAARPRPRAMEPAGRRSRSPEDRSEGNETLSAPSEFLAEFLSAIMRRQYAEALKYCRLILQYEPHNATARGFYPLLRHKVARAQRTEEAAAAAADDSSSYEAGAGHHSPEDSPSRQEELMEHSAESEGESEASAAGDHSELELDSSDALHSSPSLSLSHRTDSASGASGASGASAGCWDSSGSASRSEPAAGADADDNGNAAPAALTAAPALHAHLLPEDLQNDNAACTRTGAGSGGGEPHHSSRLKSESVSSLRRLRAHFACSIK